MQRASTQASRAGAEIASARAELGWKRADVARKAGVSEETARRIEDGDPGVQINTLCAIGSAVGLDVVIQTYPGRQPSLRDSGQLEVARHLVAMAHAAWRPELEVAAGPHGEAVDVAFFGAMEIIDAEIERLLLDFQRQLRRAHQKRDWLAALHQRPIRLVFVVADTRRNRAAVAPHAEMIARALPATTREINRALRTGQPLGRDGLLWVRTRRLDQGPTS